MGCPIRISTDQSLLAAPHGFSQRATSFIASWCQGIHRMPFFYSINTGYPEGEKPASPCTGTRISRQGAVLNAQERSADVAIQTFRQTVATTNQPPIPHSKTQHFTRRTARHHDRTITATSLNVGALHRWQYFRITRSLYRSDRPR